MIFRTTLAPTKADFGISHAQSLLLVGSCFTEAMGHRLAAHKFNVSCNPFGIVYNPVSISRCLQRLQTDAALFGLDDLFEHAGLWRSWEHHGSFAHPDRAAALAQINTAYQHAAHFLANADVLLLTLGTAEVSEIAATGQIVANNHKMPAQTFRSRRLSVEETASALETALSPWLEARADRRVTLTVSPVRHWRLGAVENQRSKATLVLTCADLCERLPRTVYFPAYELLLDDLRDYRFYAQDMVHPSETAEDYIWSHFGAAYFSENTQQLNVQLAKLRAALQHRPFHPNTPAHQTFLRQQLAVVEALERTYPYLDFNEEKKALSPPVR